MEGPKRSPLTYDDVIIARIMQFADKHNLQVKRPSPCQLAITDPSIDQSPHNRVLDVDCIERDGITSISHIHFQVFHLESLQHCLPKSILLRHKKFPMIGHLLRGTKLGVCFTCSVLCQECAKCNELRANMLKSDLAMSRVVWLWQHATTVLLKELRAAILAILCELCI